MGLSALALRPCICHLTIFNIFFSETSWPMKVTIYVEPSLETSKGGKNLYKWPKSHDQDGCQADIPYGKNLQKSSSEPEV